MASREEIEKARVEYIKPGFPYKWKMSQITDFALDMVRLHNEELAKIAEQFEDRIPSHFHTPTCPVAVARAIRKAKP